MKITCTTEKVIEVKESCKKTYCCNKLKIAMNAYKESDTEYLSSNFEIEKDRVRLTTHHSYHNGDHDMTANFCLFCGKPLIVEHKKVDKTGLPPKPKPAPRPRPAPVAAPPKKKTWWHWSWFHGD